MKFFSIAAIISLIATAMSAQGIEIGAPSDGAQIKAGRKFKVEIMESIGFRTSSPMLSRKRLVKCEPVTNNNYQICSA